MDGNEGAPATFVRDWLAAWNRSDVEAVLSWYAEDAVLLSPLAAALTGSPEVRGKAALGEYWTKALRARPAPPHFTLVSFAWDAADRSLWIAYASYESGRTVRKCEWMQFRPDGLIYRGEAFVGSTVGSAAEGP